GFAPYATHASSVSTPDHATHMLDRTYQGLSHAPSEPGSFQMRVDSRQQPDISTTRSASAAPPPELHATALMDARGKHIVAQFAPGVT
ncbi:hypothetical protein VSS92_28735, partial [Pseudomonas syringae pv. tagetis]